MPAVAVEKWLNFLLDITSRSRAYLPEDQQYHILQDHSIDPVFSYPIP